MEIRNILDAVRNIKSLDRAREHRRLTREEEIAYSELKSYIEFMCREHMNRPDSIHVDRRRDPRLPLDVRVTYESASDFYEGFMVNISKGGIYVKTDKPMPLGTTLVLHVRLDEEKIAFSLPSKVVWSSPLRKGKIPAGMGVKFTSLTALQREILDGFIDGVLDVMQLTRLAEKK